MKKLWATLLCALLISALLGAMATDALPGDEAGIIAVEAFDAGEVDEEAPEAPVDTMVPYALEPMPDMAEIPQDEADVVTADAVEEAVEAAPDEEILGETVAEDVVADEAFVASDTSEFTIRNGELISYDGSGGDVVIPSGVTSIRKRAFYRETNVTSVVIPEGVTSIGEEAFYKCSLTKIQIPQSVTSIGDYAFAYSGLTEISFPDHLTKLPSNVCYNCAALTSVKLPSELTSIGSYAFGDCSQLGAIEIPSSVTTIGHGAFRGCAGLKTLVIPASVTKIDLFAFMNCTGLTSVTLESAKPQTYFGSIDYSMLVFSGCPSTMVIHVLCETAASKWASEQGFPVEKTSHVEVTLPAKAPTTTSTGLTEGKKCSVCGTILVAQEEIAMIVTPSPSPTPRPTTIRVNKNTTKKVYLGSTLQIQSSKNVMGYSSSNRSVATVDSSGLITTRRAGTTKITLKIMGKRRRREKAVLTLKVLDPSAPTKVSITQGKSVTLKAGQTQQLNTSLTPKTAKTTLTWKSSKKAVATVDANGVITAKKKGTAVITVITKNKKKATIKVKVK